jgi:hypothetical protein
MSQTPWTDGKWTTTPDGNYVGIKEDYADGQNWMSICQVFTHSLIQPSEMKANSRLIASAPELAEALSDGIDNLEYYVNNPSAWDHYSENVSERIGLFIKSARAALAKAKGE